MANIANHVVSDIGWYPVDFKLVGEQFNLRSIPIVFANGMTFDMHECLVGCKDIKFNKKTSLFLTTSAKAEDFIDDSITMAIEEPLSVIKTPLSNLDSKILVTTSLSSQGYVAFGGRLAASDRESFTQDDAFILRFYDDYVTIMEEKTERYLTWLRGVGQGNIILFPRIYPIIENQKFKYFLGDDNIILFEYSEFFDNIVLADPALIVNTVFNTNVYGLSAIPSNYLGDIPQSAVIRLPAYQKREANQSNLKNSFLVQYHTNQLVAKDALDPLSAVSNLPYSQNHLGIFPFEYPTISASKAVYPLYLHGLKNYQTPEYSYALHNTELEVFNDQPGVCRSYDKIFTGTNQSNGLENVFLGFQSPTIQLELKPNTETYFHYPPTAVRRAIGDSNLIEAGAIAGETPFISDRLFLRQQDYTQENSLKVQPLSIQNNTSNNTWLCSWLHLSSNNQAVWMDRFYNASYYTVSQALTSKVYVREDKVDVTKDYTYDSPSTMYLEPGASYRFYHVGTDTRKDYLQKVKTLENDPHLEKGAMFLHLEKWDTSPLVDSSPYSNRGILYFNKPENLQGDHLVLDGNNHVVIPSQNVLLEKNQLTVALWLDVDDWNDVSGSQIFGNYYESGFGLINDSALTTPIITLVNGNDNTYQSINYQYGEVGNDTISIKDTVTQNKFIQRTSDYSLWIVDAGKLCANKYNIEGQRLKTSTDPLTPTVSLSSLSAVSQIELDANENLFVYDDTIKKYTVISSLGAVLSSAISVPTNTKGIQIDMENRLVPVFGTRAVIDNNNVVWQILGGNLYKGTDSQNLSSSRIFANIGKVQDMTCDANGDLWIAHDQDTITKIDTTQDKVVLTERVGKFTAFPINRGESLDIRKLHMIRVPTDSNTDIYNKKDKTEDRLIIIDSYEKMLYQLDTNGSVLTRKDLTVLFNDNSVEVYANGDITGYQNMRKFSAGSKKMSWKLKAARPDKAYAEIHSLDYDLSTLCKGPHHFAFTFDTKNGNITSYLDGLPYVQKTNLFADSSYEILYNFRTSLLLGIQSIKNTTLNDIVAIDNGYKFIGKVADLRMYGKSLTDEMMKQIYYSTSSQKHDRSIFWDMHVGSRSYVEDVKSWFKMQLPGSKSKYYNINIRNLDVVDDVKLVIEDAIKKNLAKITPAESNLYRINWI